MANAIRGEVGVVVNGRTYTLRPGLNAMCALEERMDQGIDAIRELAMNGRVSGMRALVWAYLQDCHGDEIVTFEDAGRWMDEAGGLAVVAEQIAKANAINAMTDDKVATTNGSGKRRPRRAQAGDTSTLSVGEPA